MSITSFNMSHSSLLSSPSSLFHNTKTKHYFLTIPLSKQLSCFKNPSLSLTVATKTHRFPFLAFVAQTSDWAQQEDKDSTFTFEDQEVGETEAGLSGLEPNAEDAEGEGEGAGEEEEEEEGEFEEGGFPEPPEEAKLFVGNLPYDVDSQKLAMLFEEAGTVEVAEVIFNRDTNQSRGFGFVTMSTVEEADNAVEKFNRYDLDGRLLTVNKASPRGSRAEPPPRNFEAGSRVYVGNLPWDVDNNRLEQIFSEHGKVENARVVYDRETGRSRGFGFVTFSDETEMNDAIAALDGQSLEGRAIRVNVAEDRPRRSSF
ncbi:hypothetical protein TanjilG_11583 [Lupinus angustifolius]|uniref:RRM domain-containing protein n=1 Tax=Lupinus angustifolius TaxID=3871 RepID=A0A1J7HCK4_LUPAN|nr:PREDICTED: 28 kDa ribonucleoprotein, chloroplastic-like [Lupinus angustifolius]XP_019415397.1 PREDICTED: 28 kDa ribonucleoprotein, chloroplastic-like [Lupinus angustifolius]OIV98186.1 hypothetical protein TanjilG_11583 [Lupinus angustifolius]